MKPLKPFIFVYALLLFSALQAAPKADLWSFWQQSGTASGLDHTPWQSFLDRYLSAPPTGPTRVNYAGVSEGDKKKLKAYLKAMSGVAIRTYRRSEQFAYWVNLYNAKTVELILDHYPVASITKIKPSFFSFGPWDMKLLEVEGQALSLNDLEHRILRPIWQDERIHYVVNCASISCPNLAARAVPAAGLDAFLEAAAAAYINDDRALRFEGRTLVLSSIYDWYAVDFGSREELARHLAQYHRRLDAATIRRGLDRVDYEYDWGLNQPAR